MNKKFSSKELFALIAGLFVLIAIIFSSAVIFKGSIFQKLLNKIGFYNVLRTAGIAGRDLGGFFKALELQDLAYDYNNDGVVGGDDFNLMVEKIGLASISSTETTTSADTTDTSTGGDGEIAEHLPTIRGFSTNEFEGSAVADFSFDLPSSAANMVPSVSLNYSSGSVDDLQTGTPIWFRNGNLGSDDLDYQNASYINQAGIAGLGWNLGVGGSISYDSTNENFVISVDGGIADLIKIGGVENFGTGYTQYRTIPDLQIKVDRYQICYYVLSSPEIKKDDYYQPATYLPVCRSQWYVHKGDGTKYTFGNDVESVADSWKRRYDATATTQLYGSCYYKVIDKLNVLTCSPVNNVVWFPLYEKEPVSGEPFIGAVSWKYGRVGLWEPYHYYAQTKSYFLKEVVSPFSNAPKIMYENRLIFDTDDDNYIENGSLFATYPHRILYGDNQVDFVTEPRFDYKISTSKYPEIVSDYASKERIDKIKISSLGKIYKVYDFDYIYGWKPSLHNDVNQNGVPDDSSEVVVGRAVHSLLSKISTYNDDPSQNADAAKLPPTTFSYGENCDGFTGGCPLKSYTFNEYVYTVLTADGPVEKVGTNYPTARTPNDFFLQSVDNGYGAKVEFNYWSGLNSAGAETNALTIKTCDYTGYCSEQLPMNLQRHRIESKMVYDGMGDRVKTVFNYTTDVADGYAKQLYKFVCNPDYTICKDCWESYSEARCYCQDSDPDDGVECSSKVDYKSLLDYKFLGYPEVETVVYEKNSDQTVVSRSTRKYNQYIKELGCFKPSPFKGIVSESMVYDVSDSGRYVQSSSNYSVRFASGTNYKEINENDIDSYCSNYSLYSSLDEITKNAYSGAEFFAPVSTIMKLEDYSRESVSGENVLCTKSTYDYKNLDGTMDVYANVHKTVNYGSVDCVGGADINETPVVSVTDYTSGSADPWRTPLAKEGWTTDLSGAKKYGHSRNYYDNQSFGVLGDYGNLTKTEKLADGVVYSSDSFVFSDTYPWQNTKMIDANGNQTEIVYDDVLKMYPVETKNVLGHTAKIEYDFNTTDVSHPNYDGNSGLVVKSTDVNGAITTNVYDEFGRLKEVYLPGKKPGTGVMPNRFIEYYYNNPSDVESCTASNHCLNDLGLQIDGLYGPKMVVYQGARYSDEGVTGSVSLTHTFYNGLGQKMQTRNLWYDGDYSNAGILAGDVGDKVDIINSVEYNSLGKVTYQSSNYTDEPYINQSTSSYDSRDWINSTDIASTRTVYDGFGRSEKAIMPDGSVSTISYDIDNNPLKTTVFGPNCNDGDATTLCLIQTETKNAFGNVVEGIQTEQESGKSYQTLFEYHPILGSLVKTIDTFGNANSIIEYDSLGRKVKMWDVDMSPSMSGDENSWRYYYDKTGNLVKQIDPKGIETDMVYDDLNRSLSKNVSGVKVLGNYYDCSGNLGRLCKTDSYDLNTAKIVMSKNYSYDGRGRISKASTKLLNMPDDLVNDTEFITEFSYDEGDRVLSTKMNSVDKIGMDQETTTNEYMQPYLYRINTTEDPYNYLQSAFYTKNGQLISYTTNDNTKHAYNYNRLNNRLLSIYVTNDMAGEDYIYTDYDYDTSGNIISIKDGLSEGMMDQNFEYDYLNRLVSASGAYSADYSYDDIGNIISKVEGDSSVYLTYGDYSSGYYHRPLTQSEYPLGAVAEQEQEVNNYSYDEIGSMIAKGDVNYQYDNSGRLIKAIVPVVEELEITPTPTVVETEPSADANEDGVIDSKDYDIWLSNYSVTTALGILAGDFNMDGKVDGVDYNIWRNQYSTIIPTDTITPEPTTPTPTLTLLTVTPEPTSSLVQCSQLNGICRSMKTGCIDLEVKSESGYCRGANVCCVSK